MFKRAFSDQEYLELCQKLVERQYDDVEKEIPIQMEWIPSEPEIKQKMRQASTSGTIDLTNVRSTKIKDEILKCTNLKIGFFKVRIMRYHEVPSQTGPVMTCNVQVLEERHKTPNGMDCKIDYPLNLDKDTRFANRPWLKYFKGNIAFNVPIDTVVEIIRWMQAVKKLTVFL